MPLTSAFIRTLWDLFDREPLLAGSVIFLLAVTYPVILLAVVALVLILDILLLLLEAVLMLLGFSWRILRPRRSQRGRNRIALRNAKRKFEQELEIARSHRDRDEREAYAAGAAMRYREELARIGQPDNNPR